MGDTIRYIFGNWGIYFKVLFLCITIAWLLKPKIIINSHEKNKVID